MVADYGVRREDMPGYSGVARRSIFVIDRDGVIRYTWTTTPEQRMPDYDAVMAAAKEAAGAA